jgi:hypothetical protein
VLATAALRRQLRRSLCGGAMGARGVRLVGNKLALWWW